MPRYLPPLSLLISVDNLPSSLGFLENGLNTVFTNLYFKNLYSKRSIYTQEVYYDITIVSYERLGLNLGGDEGFALVLNPNFTDGDISEFPMSVSYNWPLLKYINGFDISTFDFSIGSIYNLLLDIGNIDEAQLLSMLINVFYPDFAEEESEEPFQKFIDDFNNNNSPTTQLTYNLLGSELEIIEDLITQLSSNGNNFNIFDIVKDNYLTVDDNFGTVYKKIERLFSNILGNFNIDNLSNFLIPKFSASLNNLFLALEFPRTWLKPVNPSTLEVIEDESIKSMITYNAGSLYYSTESGLDFNQIDSFDLTPSQIGNTGLIIEVDELKFDFRSDRNIPEATADDRPDTFKGIYADLVSITLPKKWFNTIDNTTLQIAGRNLLIGTGGVSGKVSLETTDNNPNDGADYMSANIGNWELGFNHFDITFKQNAIIESRIAGRLKIPKLKDDNNQPAEILINGHLNEEGDFNLTASESDGISRNLFNFVRITFLTLELGKKNNDFYIGTSCRLKFINPIMDKILQGQEIEIPRLRIYENGSIEIVGGNTFIPTNISLNLGPVEIAVTGVHFGSHQQEYNGVTRKYNYWGFDGAISLDPLGIDARGEGIKYYYTVDNDEYNDDGDSFLRIQTIEIDLIIPGTASPESAVAIIHGMVSIPEPGESPEYIGELSLKLPKAKISGGASMRLQPRHPAFLLDAHIGFPAPIPLGPLGIYGFRGLLGFRYVAEKEAVGLVSGEDTWYDYYTYPPKGVDQSKFSGPERTAGYDFPFSIGAGAVLGTSFDSGTVLSMRMMMLLSMPTMFLLDGKASILASRLGLDDTREPPFFFFTILGDNSLEFGMGADFKLPQSNGWILDLQAEVQAGFFFNNPRAWYVNFGTKDNPITARVLTIITAQSYLMLSATGIEAGARVEIDIIKRFGPARVRIYAYLEMGGFISFERPQIGGYLALGGMVDINIWIVGVTIGLDALFSVEAARPFLIYAEIRLRVCVRIVFKVCKSFTIKMKWEKNGQVDRTPIAALPYQNNEYNTDRTEELVQAVHMLTNESFALTHRNNWVKKDQNTIWEPPQSQITNIIPLDSYIDIKAVKGLIPSAISNKIGGHTGGADNFTDLIPPQKVVRGGRELRQVKHKYSIEDIEIKAWTGNNWMDYHPFEALVKAEDRDLVDHLRIGYWQRKGNQYDAIRLLATNPFSYIEAGEPGWVIPEEYGITPSELFCQSIRRSLDCADVLNKNVGTVYYPPTQYVGHNINGPYFTLEGNFETTVTINPDGTQTISISEDNFRVTDVENNFEYPKSLEFDNGNSLVIILPEPVVKADLKLTTNSAGVIISYYKSNGLENNNAVYELIHEKYKTNTQLQQVVGYENEANFISKIIINPELSEVLENQLRYEIYNEIDDDGIDEYRFRIFNDRNEIILSSSTRYSSEEAAIAEMRTSLFNIINYEESVKVLQAKNQKWYFNIIDRTGEVIARRIEYFETLADCEKEIDELKSIALNKRVLNVDEETGDTSGSQNDKICADYDKLVKIFEDCFVNVQTSEQVDLNIHCFVEFGDILRDSVNNSSLPNAISTEYDNYISTLELITGLVGHHEQILRFTVLKESAERILSLLSNHGDCGCSPCAVVENLREHYNNCLTLSDTATLKELNSMTSCLEELIGIVNCEDNNPPRELNKTVSFDYDSSTPTQNGHYHIFNLAELTTGTSSTNGIQKIRIVSVPSRGELGIIDTPITNIPADVTIDNINDDRFFFWADDTDGNGDPGSYTTVFQFIIVDNNGNDTDIVTMTINATDTYRPSAPPSLIQVSNTNTGAGGTRTQIFEVGGSISAGNKFNLTVYSYTNTVIAVAGDTPITIAAKLRDAINNTSLAQWDSVGSAPNNGTNGYPPSATSNGDRVTIILNFQNQFAANATVN